MLRSVGFDPHALAQASAQSANPAALDNLRVAWVTQMRVLGVLMTGERRLADAIWPVSLGEPLVGGRSYDYNYSPIIATRIGCHLAGEPQGTPLWVVQL